LVKFLFLELRIFSAHRVSDVRKLNVFYVVEFYYEIVKPEEVVLIFVSEFLYFSVQDGQQTLKGVVSFYYTYQITPTCFGS
jgi:hypothetical protein